MSLGKRLFDMCLSVFLGGILLPILLAVMLIILVRDGRPIFFLSERMKSPERGFLLVKFRTMTVCAGDSGVSGGHKAARITKTGRVLRAYRLDELPQLWNIFKGDMSFVGPRPPLRLYVERFPMIYSDVLRSRPGVTGLATLKFHAREGQLLGPCGSAEETDRVYSQRCVPRKAHLDLIYQKNSSFCFDLRILFETARSVLRRSG